MTTVHVLIHPDSGDPYAFADPDQAADYAALHGVDVHAVEVLDPIAGAQRVTDEHATFCDCHPIPGVVAGLNDGFEIQTCPQCPQSYDYDDEAAEALAAHLGGTAQHYRWSDAEPGDQKDPAGKDPAEPEDRTGSDDDYHRLRMRGLDHKGRPIYWRSGELPEGAVRPPEPLQPPVLTPYLIVGLVVDDDLVVAGVVEGEDKAVDTQPGSEATGYRFATTVQATDPDDAAALALGEHAAQRLRPPKAPSSASPSPTAAIAGSAAAGPASSLKEFPMTTVTLYAHAAPAHEHTLFTAPRPLPGRLVGHVAGMVFDVAPQYQQEAGRLDGHPITLITPAGLERLAERLLVEDSGYTRADYEAAGVWDPEGIARERGHAIISITPYGDAGPLIDATDAGETHQAAITDIPAATGADASMRVSTEGGQAAAAEKPPTFAGDYTGIDLDVDDYGIGSLQLVAPGAYIGEDPEPTTTPSLIFGDPGDMGVCVHGTPDRLLAWVARVEALAAELVAEL